MAKTYYALVGFALPPVSPHNIIIFHRFNKYNSDYYAKRVSPIEREYGWESESPPNLLFGVCACVRTACVHGVQGTEGGARGTFIDFRWIEFGNCMEKTIQFIFSLFIFINVFEEIFS